MSGFQSAVATGPAGATGAAGAAGAAGSNGTNGQGVPTGGTTDQVLSKINNTDYNTQWVTPSAGGVPETFYVSTNGNAGTVALGIGETSTGLYLATNFNGSGQKAIVFVIDETTFMGITDNKELWIRDLALIRSYDKDTGLCIGASGDLLAFYGASPISRQSIGSNFLTGLTFSALPTQAEVEALRDAVQAFFLLFKNLNLTTTSA